MRNRRRQFDMPHALAANLGQRNFDAALLAHDTAVFHSFVLAAQALVVLNRAENARAEQTVAFRLKSAVVDGLGLFDFAVRPRTDLLRRSNGDFDFVKRLGNSLLTKKIHNIVHICKTPFIA